jgi:phospholipid transport system substrate-binding protein
MKREIAYVPLLGLLMASLLFGFPSRCLAAEGNQPAPATARAVMEKLTQDVISILRDAKLSPEEKRQKVQDLAIADINFEIMARLSLGRPWRDITDDQRARYSREFQQHVINTYGQMTDHYTDEDVKIVGDRQESDGDWTVQTSIIGDQDGTRKEVAKVDYRLRNKENQWKVVDFTIDGVSLISNFRSQFQEIMSNGGIEHLIKLLHDKNAADAK